MRNLKKILALVLALVMSLSLVTMANADYADQADIDNAEAVAVMSAIGVLQGSDGKFNPDGILTREQAAKIITYLVMGKDKADKLTTDVAPFADVKASSWSAGSIAYCADNGILNGVGGGKFNPTGKLTGLQFAKMVLCAMGYDASIEGMTGDTFAIKTATLAIDLGLDKDVSVDLSQPLSRENAAQMAFNALELDNVYYMGGTTVELPGGTKVVVGATRYTDEDKQLMDKYADKLDKVDVPSDEEDVFGRPAAYAWQYDAKTVYTAAAKAAKTYTGVVKAENIWKDLGKAKDLTVVRFINGEPAAAVSVAKGTTDKVGALNTAVEVYYDKDAKLVTIVEVKYDFGKVNKVNAEKLDKDGDVETKANIVIDITPANKDDSATLSYNTTDFAKGDNVLYATVKEDGNDVVKVVKLADSFEGKVTAKKGDDVTIGGASYTNDAGLNVGDEGTFFKGVCGAVVFFDGKKTEKSDNWAYVYNVKADTQGDITYNEDGFEIAPEDAPVKAYVVLADGTKATYVIDKDFKTAIQAGDVVCYKLNSDGEIEVAEAKSTDATEKKSVDFGKSAAVVDKKYTSAATNFVFSYVKSEEGKPDVLVTKVVTGYKNVVSDTKEAVAIFDTETDKVITVFVMADVKVETVENKDIYVLFDAEYTETKNDDDETLYTYDVVLKGEKTTLTAKSAIFAGKDAGYTFTIKETDGYLTEAVPAVADEIIVQAVVDEYIVVADEPVYCFEDVEVYAKAEKDWTLTEAEFAKDDKVLVLKGLEKETDTEEKIFFAIIIERAE